MKKIYGAVFSGLINWKAYKTVNIEFGEQIIIKSLLIYTPIDLSVPMHSFCNKQIEKMSCSSKDMCEKLKKNSNGLYFQSSNNFRIKLVSHKIL